MALQILKIVFISGALILFIDFANNKLSDSEPIKPESILFKKGDNPKWADPSTQVGGWEKDLPADPGIGWVRAYFNFKEDYSSQRNRELIVAFLGAYELYWQGVLIGKTGEVSDNSKNEVPGHIDMKFIIPDSLVQKGKKVLSLRYSDHQNTGRIRLLDFSIERYGEFFTRALVQSVLIYGLAGIFLIVAIYYFLMYFYSYQNTSYLLFSALCGVSFLLILFAYSRYQYPYEYPFYDAMQIIISILSFSITVLLPLFYLYYFRHPSKKLYTLAIPLLLFSVRVLPGAMPIYTALAIILPFYFVIWALLKRKRGVTEAAIGLTVFVTSFMYYDATVYFGFGILIIATLFTLSKTLGIERKKHEEAKLKSSRLEVEVLKRNIQPHFLMNTLMNIISLIESHPEMSVKLIEALSDEFYTMLEISDKKLIPASKEIELCRSHLEVMGIRNDVHYELEASGPIEDELIPPAVFHTIIENGMKHNEPKNGIMKFHISFEEQKEKKLFKIHSCGVIPEENYHKKMGDGTGLKYIRTRLEESYPNRWNLDSHKSDTGWETIIEIRTE